MTRRSTTRKERRGRGAGVSALSGVAALLFWLAFLPQPTSAYTVSSVLTPGCHEDMTSEALRAVRSDVPGAAPMAPTHDEQALIDDLQFNVADDMRDLAAVTLLLGVRDNDLKGRSSDDLTQLAEVHGNPDNQDEHCLRSEGQDEPGGSEAAVLACRAFIRGRVAQFGHTMLYRSHQSRLHGFWRGGLIWLVDRINSRLRPSIRLD